MLTLRRLLTALTIVAATAGIVAADSGSIALTGRIDGTRLRAIADSLPELRRLDLSEAAMTTLPAYSLAGTAIEELLLPDGLTAIGEGALAGTHLRSLTLPPAVTVIGPYALSDCTALESVSGGESLRIIGRGALRRCRSLTSVPFPPTLDSIGASALRGSAIVSADLSGCLNLRSIGAWALAGCTSLESVSLPPHMERIGLGAFFGDISLRSVTFTGALDSIADFAFTHAAALADVDATELSGVPALGTGTWHGVDQPSATLTVADAMLSAFASTPGWKEFRIIPHSGVSAIDTADAPGATTVTFAGNDLIITSDRSVRVAAVYGTDGRMRLSADLMGSESPYSIDATALPAGLYIVAITFTDGTLAALKALK